MLCFKQFIVKKSNIVYFMVKTSKLNMHSTFSSISFSNLCSSTVSTSNIPLAVVWPKLGHDLVSVCPHMKENYKYLLSLWVTKSPKYIKIGVRTFQYLLTAASPFCGTIRHTSYMYILSTCYFRFIITVNVRAFPHSDESAASIDVTLVGCYHRFLELLSVSLQLWHDWRSSVTHTNVAASVWLQIKENILSMQSCFTFKVLDITWIFLADTNFITSKSISEVFVSSPNDYNMLYLI